jgi:hypothetical protein
MVGRPGSQGGGDDRPGLAYRSAYRVDEVMGGPILIRKDDKHIVVYA